MNAGFDDFVRTRLTHTLEVAQIGRDLSTLLGCSSDIVEAACLAHDLGHPPFGHNGETALNEVAYKIGGFEGNAQTLRLISYLEPKAFNGEQSVGLNLTRATLDACVKYPWTRNDVDPNPPRDRTVKFGVYEEDLTVFQWAREGIDATKRGKKCIEAQVMDFADDVAYSVHDVEDALVSGNFSGNSLNLLLDDSNWSYVLETTKKWYGEEFLESEFLQTRESLKRLGALDVVFDGTRKSFAALKNMTSTLIGTFVNATYRHTLASSEECRFTRYNADLHIPRETLAQITLLKGFSAAFVMAPIEEKQSHQYEREIIFELAKYYESGKNLDLMFASDFAKADTDDARLRIIVDQIACLTDFSATQKVKKLASLV